MSTSTPVHRPIVSRCALALLTTLSLCAGCVDEPDDKNGVSDEMDLGAQDAAMAVSDVTRIEIVLDGAMPNVDLLVRQGQSLSVKIQGFDTTGALIVDNLISQTTISFEDVAGGVTANTIDRSPLVLGLNGNVVEVLERGRARMIVHFERADGAILSDTLLLDATQRERATGTLPALTTLRLGEPLPLNETLTIAPEGAVERVSLLDYCATFGELTTSGAVRLDATNDVDFASTYEIVGERTGLGTLDISCDALADAGLPAKLSYRFRVELATEVRAGDEHTCALLRSGNSAASEADSSLLCWGKNERGQVGSLIGGKRQDVTKPTAVFASTQGPVDVDAGPEHTCALAAGQAFSTGLRSADLFCWGDNRLGQSVPRDRENAPTEDTSAERRSLYSTPAEIDVAYVQFAQVCAGEDYSCALSDQGRLLCWGTNSYGQLGDAAELGDQVTRPTELFAGRRYADVGCGAQHICATRFDGESECWGRNLESQLGVAPAEMTQSTTPVPLKQESNKAFRFEQLSLGEHTSCGVTLEGWLFCWGNNRRDQITDFIQEELVSTPTRINLSSRPEERVESISIGSDHACAITTASTLPTDEGDACLYNMFNMPDPDSAPGQSIDGTCALRGQDNRDAFKAWRDNGTEGVYEDCITKRTYCWGAAEWGQIIDKSKPREPKPQMIRCEARAPEGIPGQKSVQNASASNFFDDYQTITVGISHSCAAGRTTVGVRDSISDELSVETKEKVWCWGRTDNGKLGSTVGAAIVKPSATSTFKALDQKVEPNQAPTLVHKGRADRPIGQPREIALGAGHSCVRTCLAGDNPNKLPEDDCEDLFDAQHHVLCWGSNHEGQRAELDGFDIITSTAPTAPSSIQIAQTTPATSHTYQRLVSGTDHLCLSYQSFEREAPEQPRYLWEDTSGLRCWGKNTFQQAGPAINTSLHGNPNTGISGGPDVDCQAVNFGDKLGDAHSCSFTLIPNFRDLYFDRFHDMSDPLAFDYAASVLQCWNRQRVPQRPRFSNDEYSYGDLTFAARGQAYCWGNGTLGHHGLSFTTSIETLPAPSNPAGGASESAYFNGIASSASLNCGWDNTLSTAFGDLECWGHDPYGLVKSWEITEGVLTPKRERVLYSPTKVNGWNDSSQLSERTKSVERMAIGESHICAVANPQIRHVICWGENTYGQAGRADVERVALEDAAFVELSKDDKLTDVIDISAGDHHTCALTSSRQVYCWGRNDRGQVGALDEFGNVSDNLYAISRPYEVKALERKFVKEIKAFGDHTCALVADNEIDSSPASIHCWGENDRGQSACWTRADTSDVSDATNFCTSSTPWAQNPFITQAFP